MPLQPTLQDELIKIVPLTKNDFESLFTIASDPMIWEQHPQPDRWKKEIFQTYFDEAIDSGSAFLVYEKKTNQPIGCTRYYEYDPGNSGIAIGYTFLARPYWGGRYNWSMKKLLIDHAFSFVDRVLFHVGKTNVRSQRALEKIGAVKIGDWEQGEKPPHYEYEIRKDAWQRGQATAVA